ncbi:MAG: hypothetical protein MI741_16195 [Rhodospirillales bacterium]|nr:hypothetical protein [Rhodospirillales bacterium]
MQIYLDDEQVDAGGTTLGRVLTDVQNRLNMAGRIVVEVKVDGETLVGNELSEGQDRDLTGCDVRLYSAEPARLAVDTLEGIRGRLNEARNLQQQAADAFQSDQAGEALQHIARLIEIWMQTQQAVTLIASMLEIDMTTMKVDGVSGGEIVEKLVEHLNSLKQAIGDSDTVTLADSLAYEWPEVVDQWDNLAAELIQRVNFQT